jgi:hypothetical protein
VKDTPWGKFDIQPKPGQTIIPRNFGQASGYFAVNMRISKTVGFGPSRNARSVAAKGPGGATTGATTGGATDTAQGGAARGRGGDGGFGGGGPRGGGGGAMGGMFGGGGGGPGGANDKRYQMTFSVNVNNILNHANLDIPVGNLSSPLFGLARRSANPFGGFGGGGGGGGAAGNRKVELQVRFNF